MSEPLFRSPEPEPPAMGERRARCGYGYQDKVATERILHFLRSDLRDGTSAFEGARLADLDAGRVDDFVLVWKESVEGNSLKWSAAAAALTWGEFVGQSGLLRELASGWNRLRRRWPGRTVTVRLHTNRPVSRARHQAQLFPSLSLADFVATHWTAGPEAAHSPDASKVWHKIADHVGLSGSDLSSFVAHCDLAFEQLEPPTAGPDSFDWRHYRKQFDLLHNAIATWLTNNPRGDLLDRAYLLGAIGLHASQSGLIQRFPQPDIPYEKNQAASGQLATLLDTTTTGYVAVVGPAGVGKSTLVQDVLTDSAYPFLVPYYAYLPATDGNRDRAEALTFFQDVVARLDRFDSARYSLGISNVPQGRDALRRHMQSANKRQTLTGHKTILLLDGLDHVTREVNLQRSVLHELPHPSEIPDGFLIILSGQPQAFHADAVSAAIAATVAEEDRRLEVSGLSRGEVHALLARHSKPTTGQERDSLHNACLGNPLVLTYLLSLLERPDERTVAEAIELAGNYAGHIDTYYKERLSVALQDVPTRKLLGLLCRAAPTLPTAWLSQWPEKNEVEDVYQRVLAPFVREDGGTLTFIHNSLIAFLKANTRSRLPGSDPVADERTFHSLLADRSYGRSCLDPVGRARVVHLMRAQRHSDVLEELSSDWLRSAMRGFLPYAHVRPLILAGHVAAAAAPNWGQTLRLLLLDHELDQRSARIDAGHLANALLNLDAPQLSLAQIRTHSRLLVDDHVALRFAGTMWWYAHGRNRADLKAAARTLYLQAKPISLIHAGQPIDTFRHHEQLESLGAWSDVAALFEDPHVVAQEIQQLDFRGRNDPYGPDRVTTMARLLFNALDAALHSARDPMQCRAFVEAIRALQSDTWYFCALLRVAELAPSEVPVDLLQAAHEAADTNDDVNLAYADFLNQQGNRARAADIVGRLRHIRFDLHRQKHSWGYTDVTYTTMLRCLQEMLGLPEGAVPEAIDGKEEAHARVERAARQVGYYLALAARGRIAADRRTLLRALLLFYNQPVDFDTVDPHHRYILQTSRDEIYDQVIKLARVMGNGGIRALADVVTDLTSGPSATPFAPHQRRRFAEVFHDADVMTREQAIRLGLSSTSDADDDDPAQRHEACLEVATFLKRIGDGIGSEHWKRRATEVSAGAGSHKDYHMARVAEWLARSTAEADPARLHVLGQYARAVEVSGGDGGSDGAAATLRLLLRLAPERAYRLAVEQVDRDVLAVWQVLEALIVGGAAAGAHPELLSAIYGELHAMIAPGDTSETAAAVLKTFPREQKTVAAERLMSYVRTNALPSHRAPVARALQDALRIRGIEPITLTSGLKPGHDDSSRKSTLYRLNDGAVATVRQIGDRLSDPKRPDTWNPNPEDNAEFDWWAAIKTADIKDEMHFACLVERFAPPDYRQVELLVRQAEVCLNSGNRETARTAIERAIEQSRDGSWDRWLDGAQKMVAFGGLKQLDHAEGIDRARAQFREDLAAGKASSFSLYDIGNILEFLEIDWPKDAVREAVSDYLKQVLDANPEVPTYESLTGSAPFWSVDQALCRFLAELLAFPVVEVGVAARRALATYVARHGRGLLALLTTGSWWNPLQLEHLLAAVHTGASTGTPHIGDVREFVEGLNSSESLAVRSIAKRICAVQGWVWTDITTASLEPVIVLARASSSREEPGMVIGGETTTDWRLHQALFSPLREAGLEADELRSRFDREYWMLEKEYPWTNDARLRHWMRRLLTRFWLRPGTIIGREAAMRVVGRQTLSGRTRPGAEEAYDRFYPIYDPRLEVRQPMERPLELQAMEWHLTANEEKTWRQGVGADEWNHYPDSILGRLLIGERTWLVRPEWEWPHEERSRGLIARSFNRVDGWTAKSAFDLTYEMYLEGRGQDAEQLIVLNDERQLDGPTYRWAAVNSNFARLLGWHPSTKLPFRWLDATGNVMVESIYWRDGWRRIEPPQFESLGEGWFVVASAAAIDAIRRAVPEAEVHLWVERQSHGKEPWHQKWHLTRPL